MADLESTIGMKEREGDRRPHALEPGSARCGLDHGQVCRLDADGGLTGYGGDRGNGGGAGDLTAGGAPHTVRHRGDELIPATRGAGRGKRGVLVVVAHPTGVRPGCPGVLHRTSMMVCPMRITSPRSRARLATTGIPLTSVPLVEPRSSTTRRPSTRSNRTWRSEMKGASSGMSASAPRPMSVGWSTARMRPESAGGSVIMITPGPLAVRSMGLAEVARCDRTALATIQRKP